MFDLTDKVAIITGGTGLLGRKHAEAIAEYGGHPVLIDLDQERCNIVANEISNQFKVDAIGIKADITSEKEIEQVTESVISKYGKIDILINNAANNPKVEGSKDGKNFSRLENFDLNLWNLDLNVGLTGSFICSKYFGSAISKNPNGGSIINISSDLGIIAPDQRLYSKPDIPKELQNVKPVTYSVVKSGLIGLSRYLSTYWAKEKVRCNTLCPGGVFNNQDEEFLKKVTNLIPMGRMADKDDYKGAIVFLASDASSYMNGAILSVDGGRTTW
jgi:NAD(P)-dependent dehydrogenase (short-subunit alcohol dehydrogenase family)